MLRGTKWLALLFTAPFAGILLWRIQRYLPFISDDALISLRYAQRFLEGHGLTWTGSERVEGYSNLLWVLLVALVGAFGVDLIVAARVLGVLGVVLAMWALAAASFRDQPIREAWLPAGLGLLFLALSAPLAVWAIGGLEQPLYAALIALSTAIMSAILAWPTPDTRKVWWLSLVLGLLCLTRPDGPIFTVAAVLTFLGAARQRAMPWFSNVVRLLALPLICYAGQLVFRILYYGEIVPNTALVKITPSQEHWLRGARYVSEGMLSLLPFSALAALSLASMLFSPRSRRLGVYLLAIAGSWISYVVFIGGDVFPAYRHFIPLIVVSAFALTEGGRAVAGRLHGRPRPTAVLASLLLLLFIPFVQRQQSDRHNQRAVHERWEWQCKDLAETLGAAFHRQQPLLAVTAAGCLPYWSRLPALDMMGLNDYYIPRHPPADIGKGLVGHELGDGRYVLRRNPDLIVFNVGSPPHFRSGAELEAIPEFASRYIPVVTRTEPNGYTGIVYVNKWSDKPFIGIDRSRETIAIPGFLFTGPGAVAALNEAGRLVAQVPPGHPVSVSFETELLPDWDIVVRSRSGRVEAKVEQDGSLAVVTLRTSGDSPVDIAEVVLRRLVSGPGH